ncbi:MAG: sigma-54-dependent Fis family transcriptional regulator, partial [Proteobacteria bacterium]|nr:sigma-54-dependent Fis family transcriptional regulator [Pseudomonadota bacterium]
MANDILIVDDEADIRALIAGILEDEGYDTRQAGDSDQALAEVNGRIPGLLILDIWLQNSTLDGLEILDRVKEAHPSLPVIMISGHGTIKTAVNAIKRGAYDFIEKPFKADRLLLLVRRAVEAARLKRENIELLRKVGASNDLIGSSPGLTQIRSA